MPQYASGADLLADARIRLDALPPEAAVLIVEGRDDFLVFADRCHALHAIIVAGNKPRALDAYRRLQQNEHDSFVFVLDCDYDVPLGTVTPKENLIVTRNADKEADFAELGIARTIALRA